MPIEDQSVEKTIELLGMEWMTAVMQRDRDTLERLMGTEYALLAPDLGRMERAEWIENAMGPYEITAFRYEAVDVHLYGDVAMMRSRATQAATWAGADRSRTFYVTDIWVQRDGRWQVVSRHSSNAPQ